MTDVPISDALIDSAQFQIQSVAPATPASGLVRLFRGLTGWAEKRSDGAVHNIESSVLLSVVTVTASELVALSSVPKVLVVSPGPDSIIVPVCVSTRYVPGTTPFTVDPASQIGWGYTVTRDSWDAADTLDDGQVVRVRFADTAMLDDHLETDSKGLPLLLRAGTWVVSGGNGSLKVFTLYHLL